MKKMATAIIILINMILNAFYANNLLNPTTSSMSIPPY